MPTTISWSAASRVISTTSRRTRPSVPSSACAPGRRQGRRSRGSGIAQDLAHAPSDLEILTGGEDEGADGAPVGGDLGVGYDRRVSGVIDATQSRPDPARRPAQTAIELSVSHREGPDRYLAAAEALWEGCRSTLGSVPASGRIVDVGDGRVSLVVEPGIGELRARRLTGCLTDLQVDYVLARVVSVESTP